MASLYLIIPVVLLFTALAVGIFYWAVHNKQYEDLERHGSDCLFDEPPQSQSKNTSAPKAPN